MEHNKVMRLRELDFTIKASNIGIGAKVLGYEKHGDKYNVRMEKLNRTLYEYGKITEKIYNNIVEAYDTLMDNDIFNPDSHEENIMFDVNGNVRIIDYGCCYTKEEIMDNPELLGGWFDIEIDNGEDVIAYYREDIRRYFKLF